MLGYGIFRRLRQSGGPVQPQGPKESATSGLRRIKYLTRKPPAGNAPRGMVRDESRSVHFQSISNFLNLVRI